MAAYLRVYPTAHETTMEAQEPTVHVSLGDLLPIISMAQRKNSVWLQDFLEDEVCVTPDLYEVLRTFRSYRPSA